MTLLGAWLALLGLSILPLALFVYFYARHSPWRSTLQGKTLMAQNAAMIVVLAHSVVGSLVDYPGDVFVGLGLFAVLTALFWAMFVALRRAQTEQSETKKGVGFARVDDSEEEK